MEKGRVKEADTAVGDVGNETSQTEIYTGSFDRLSSLPLDLRMKILSLLSQSSAVQTCLLSTDWKDSWKFIMNIHLDDTTAEFDGVDRLSVFGDQLMNSLRGECLLRFCLHLRLPHIERSTSWINTAICRNLRDLDLDLTDIDFPPSFFISGTLCKVKLRVVRFVMADMNSTDLVVRLPNLTKLDTSAHLAVAGIVIRIIEGSPSLNDLTLCACSFLPSAAQMPMSLKVETLNFVDSTVHGVATICHVLDCCPSVKKLLFGKLEGHVGIYYLPSTLESLLTLEVTYYCGGDSSLVNFIRHIFGMSKLKKLKVSSSVYVPPPKRVMMHSVLKEIVSDECEL